MSTHSVMKKIHLKAFLFTALLAAPQLGFSQATKPCNNNANSPITNFCVSTKDTLWRGGKPDIKGATWLIDSGIAAIVNLELLHDDLAILKSVETTLTTRVEYYKVRDWEPYVVIKPSKSDSNVARFIAVMNKAPKPVYVHCRSGQNRTGVMVASYRIIVEGVAANVAIEEMKRYGGIWAKQDEQYLLTLTPEKINSIKVSAANFEATTKPNAVVRCERGACDR
jgi:Dual specificity phosphatase, catalytic domain